MLLDNLQDFKMFWFMNFMFLLCGYHECVNDDFRSVIDTPTGPIMGTLELSRYRKPYYSFRGIPYAQPPVGELRFKAPVPVAPWKEVFHATHDGNTCLQKNIFFHAEPPIEGNEDCLYLNVYAPRSKNELYPVMVFIHYGGFFAGSSRSSLAGADYFMDRNVILVTFNYRLGIFGLYTSLDDEAPGNWGLKDQVLALKWVQKNIQAFGGNPNQVTIFGQSAGAASVHHHILSPSSRGLFHQAISESGTALNLWGKPQNEVQAVVFRGAAKVAGCDPTEDTKTIVECMRQVDANILVAAHEPFRYFYNEPLLTYFLVTEQKSARNPDPFLVDDPLTIIESGDFAKVPWIIGVTQDEGMLRSSPIVRQSKVREELNEHFDEYSMKIHGIALSVSEDRAENLHNELIDFYMNGSHKIDVNNQKNIQGLTDLYSDRIFIYGIYQTALYHSYQGHRPIWFYNFNYKGEYSFGNVFATTNETVDTNWGVSHCDELIYLFKSPDLFGNLTDNDTLMSRILIQLWTNFATYGQPISDKEGKANWDAIPNIESKYPIKNNYLHYLNIKGTKDHSIRFEMRNDFHTKRMAFWNKLKLNENIDGFE